MKTRESFLNEYNYDDVYRDGWGLHKKTSKYIINLADKIKNVVEFGSGGSTKLLLDIKEHLGYEFNIDSFDHSTQFSYQLTGEEKDFNLNVRELIQFDDQTYDEMFEFKVLKTNFTKVDDIFNTRLKNCFYNIQEGDLNNEYDLVILDGPSGNGRNIGYLHLMGRLKSGTIIIIDDFDHYDFVQKCQYMFDTEILEEEKFEHPLKGHCILRVK